MERRPEGSRVMVMVPPRPNSLPHYAVMEKEREGTLDKPHDLASVPRDSPVRSPALTPARRS